MIIGMGMLFEGGPHSIIEIGEFLAGTKFEKKNICWFGVWLYKLEVSD